MNYAEPGRRRVGRSGTKRTGIVVIIQLLTLNLLIVRPAWCQAFHNAERSIDIVNGCSRLQPDLFAAEANPAVFGTTRKMRLAVSTENAWSLPELTFSRLLAVAPAGNGAIGLGVQHAGNTDYQESAASFGYGLPLVKGSMGLLLNYRQFQAVGYEPLSSGSADFGFRIPLFPDLLTGISFSIPFAIQRGTNRTDKPAGDYRIELGFLASAQVSLFAAWVKTDGLAAAAEIGIDYAFAEHFFFVAGLHGRTGAPFGKTGWAINGWRLVLFTAYQAPLGFSPGLGLSRDRPENKKGKESRKKTVL